MRAVIQRCVEGAVTITETAETRTIGRGAVVLVGIAVDDTEEDAEFILRKVFNTKLWNNGDDKAWASSISDGDLDVLFVSQFTLHAELKGNKPSFHRALPPAAARHAYEKLLNRARTEYKRGGKIEDGQFGAMMEVRIVNDGPVTIVLDSRNRG